MFQNPKQVASLLRDVGYLADDEIATAVFVAESIEKPLLIEGPAGVGKTELAKSISQVLSTRLIRLQCYEGLDESKALYEWNYRKQLLRIQSDPNRDWSKTEEDIFSEDYLLARPLLEAIRQTDQVVLLIDEVDRLDLEAEALMLEVLSDWQVSIPEYGVIRAKQRPWVVLTSNATRELSEALKRRCVFLALTHPTVEREKEILLIKVPDLPEAFAERLAQVVRAVRSLELKKPPSIAESIDWARSLLALGHSLEKGDAFDSLGVLLKHPADIQKAKTALAPK